MTTRNHVIDNMKAIAIVLVVLGHLSGIGQTAVNIIYSFHIPLFFFASGYLLSDKKLAMAVPAYGRTLLHSIGRPYLIFFLASFLLWLLMQLATTAGRHFAAAHWPQALTGILWGSGDALFVNVVLWFFPCLIVTSLAYQAIRKFLTASQALLLGVVAAALVITGRPPALPRLPWGTDTALVALAFYAGGQWLKENAAHFLQPLQHKRRPLLAILLPAWLGAAALAGRADLNRMLFGENPELYLPLAAWGIAMTAAIATEIPDNRVSRWLSANTIIIFPTHTLMFTVFTGICVIVLGWHADFRDGSLVWAAVYATAALLLSVPLSWLLRRVLPAVFGRDTAIQ